VSLAARVLIALVLGLGAGILIASSGSSAFAGVVTVAETVGTLWVNAIRMTVVPLVVSLLIVAVTTSANPRAVGRTGGRAMLVFGGLLIVSSAFAALVAPNLFNWMNVDPATATALREAATRGADSTAAAVRQVPSFSQWLVGIVPTNPIRAAADGAMLALVVFTLAFGLALGRLALEQREQVVRLFQGLAEAMLVLVRWVIAMSPIAVFALMLPVASRTGAAAAGALGYYVVAIASICLGLTLTLYLVVAIAAGMSPARFARAVLPAQAVAVSTTSSLASLPALIDGAERKLGIPSKVTGITLPLAVSTFKIASPVVWTTAALFLGHFYGVPLGPSQIALVIATAALTSFSVPGVPHSWLLLISPLLASLGIPAEGVGLLIAVDLIPDMFATTLNVTADMAAVAIVNRVLGREPATETEPIAAVPVPRPEP
jgi:proton glutamate symport protein